MARLMDLDPLGFEQQDNELIASFPEDSFDEEAVRNLAGDQPFTIEKLEDRNWNEQWERSFEPVVVEDFCAVRAGFHEPVAGVEHELVITPKMSFGTGHHATTWMMIRQMRDIDFKDKTVFDFGTGTGILAILASRLGAKAVDATDIDDWCIDNTEENVANNQAENIRYWQSAAVPEGPYDIILANINRNVLDAEAGHLHDALNPGGSLLLSGIMPVDTARIRDRFENLGFQLQKEMERNGWVSVLLRR